MTDCASGQGCKSTNKLKATLPWVPAVMIALLPKCSFCVMAYSGAITLCSGRSIFPHAGSFSAYLIIGVGLLVILGILFNGRGKRTLIASLIASVGLVLLLLSQFVLLSSTLYTVGSILLFFGVWYNGSFWYFYHRIIPQKNQPLNTQL